MKPTLSDFYKEERKRVYEPRPDFASRVLGRIASPATAEFGIWDIIAASAKPVVAFALSILLAVLIIEVFIPQLPQRGIVDAFLDAEQLPSESLLYEEDGSPADHDVLQSVMDVEGQ
jgi:hypothetical protein